MSSYLPPDSRAAAFQRVDARTLDALRAVRSLAPTASDVLEEMGWRLAVPAAHLPLRTGRPPIVGHALTVRYLPERTTAGHPERPHAPSHLAGSGLFDLASPGDVVVIDAQGSGECSVLGGIAARAAQAAGVAGCIIDGAIRDIDEVAETGLAVWSAAVTPRSGRHYLEVVGINGPIVCGGVQVLPGDLVLADQSGICFVPNGSLDEACARIIRAAAAERNAGR